MKKEKSVYSLDVLCNTECKDDAEINFVHQVFRDCLQFYQWHYQVALDNPKIDPSI